MQKTLQRWNYPTQIYYGENAHQSVINLILSKANHVLFITDAFYLNSEVLNTLCSHCTKENIQHEIYAEIRGEPVDEDIKKLKTIYQDKTCDFIISLGGGSVLDAAKALALYANYEGNLWDLEDGSEIIDTIKATDIVPLYAIPTTAGTGSELGRVAVIKDSQTQIKRFIFHPNLTPKVVIYDPSLTCSLPKHLTATTGLDAFTHNFEAYCVDSYHPIADALALDGMRLIKDNLERAYFEPDNIDARGHLLVASGMGAMAFQKGLGAIHALSHPIGARYHIHHGLLNAIMLPHVIAFNQAVLADKLNTIEKHLHLGTDFLSWVISWYETLNLPTSLRAVCDIAVSDYELICQEALNDPSASGNPKKMTLSNTLELLEKAIAG